VINGAAEAKGKGRRCGGDAKGDEVGEGIKFLAHEGGLFAPASDFAVKEIEEEAKGHEAEGEPEVGRVGRGPEAVAH